MFLESLILKSKAEMTCFRRGVKAFYFRLWPSGRKFNALWHPSPTPSSSPKLHFKVVKKPKNSKYFKCCPSLPTLRSHRAMANARIQCSFHLNENPQTALSGFARWNMSFSGLGLTFESKRQLAPRLRCPVSPAPVPTTGRLGEARG